MHAALELQAGVDVLASHEPHDLFEAPCARLARAHRLDLPAVTLGKPGSDIHLALFERADHPNTSAIAFGATGEEFLAWKEHLESHDLELRIADHKLAWSLYFSDPYGNMHEITTYDIEHVGKHLG